MTSKRQGSKGPDERTDTVAAEGVPTAFQELSLDGSAWPQPIGLWQRRGASAWMIALACGEAQAAGDPPAQSPLVDQAGYTAWHYWAHGALAGPECKGLAEQLARHPQGTQLFQAVAQNGEHPSHRLLLRGHQRAFQAWVAQFGVSHLAELDGDNHWHCLAWQGDARFLAAVAKALPEATLDEANARGQTAAMIAVHRGGKAAVEQLLLLGANPDRQDLHGRSVLHHVAQYGDADWFGRMLDLGSDDTVRNNRGLTATDVLNEAVRHGNDSRFALLRHHWAWLYFQKTML